MLCFFMFFLMTVSSAPLGLVHGKQASKHVAEIMSHPRLSQALFQNKTFLSELVEADPETLNTILGHLNDLLAVSQAASLAFTTDVSAALSAKDVAQGALTEATSEFDVSQGALTEATSEFDGAQGALTEATSEFERASSYHTAMVYELNDKQPGVDAETETLRSSRALIETLTPAGSSRALIETLVEADPETLNTILGHLNDLIAVSQAASLAFTTDVSAALSAKVVAQGALTEATSEFGVAQGALTEATSEFDVAQGALAEATSEGERASSYHTAMVDELNDKQPGVDAETEILRSSRALIETLIPAGAKPYCVKIVTGNVAHNDGFLQVYINGVKKVISKLFGKTDVVMDTCFATLLSISIECPEMDAWKGNVRVTFNGEKMALACEGCTGDSFIGVIVADGNNDGKNQASTQCLGGNTCTLTVSGILANDNAGCYLIETESECLASRDGRRGKSFSDSPCHWCCGDACYSGKQWKCDPGEYLLRQSNYFGHSKNGVGYNTCLQPSEVFVNQNGGEVHYR